MITLNLNTKSSVPLYEQIYSYIKNEIINGQIPNNDKLPSTRKLANHLQVSRNTIDMAYDQLLSEGYIESVPKKGYYVCSIAELTHFKEEPDRILQKSVPIIQKYEYDFSPFSIDINNFPLNTWRRLSKNSLNDMKSDLFLHGPNQGDENFRNAIVKYLHESRGVNCSKEQIIIGAGADYLLQLIAQLIDKDSIIAMENPTYKKAYQTFKGLHYNTRAISLDKNGMNIAELSKSDANIAYVTPSHQYPLGIVMQVKRRLELLNWANNQCDRYIIEDDHDSEFRYKGKPIPALQGMDHNGKVIYLGTFSRAIAPAIRIAYMVLPNNLLALYKKEFYYYSSTVSRIDQDILTTFIEQGYFERHLNKMRKIYKSKHDVLIHALRIFGDKIKIFGENAGLHLIIKMNLGISEEELIDLAKENGIKLYGLKQHYIENIPKDDTTILLGYANLSEEEIEKGVRKLYQILCDSNNCKG